MHPRLEEVHQRALARILDHPPSSSGISQRCMVNDTQQHRRRPESIQVMTTGIQSRRCGCWVFLIRNRAHRMER